MILWNVNSLQITQETLPVDFGQPFSKTCEPATSVPKSRAFWILMSGQNAKLRHFRTINSTNVAFNDKGTIFFQYVREEDNIPGLYYTCTSENMELKDYQFGYQFNFKVIRNPRDLSQSHILPGRQYFSPKEVTVLKGGSLELFCIVSGYPDYIPYWSKKDGQLDYSRTSWSNNFNKSLRIDALLHIGFHCRKIHLLIHDVVKGEPEEGDNAVGEGDNAVYQCRAYNEYGSLWANFYLSIQKLRIIISKNQALEVTKIAQTMIYRDL
uniref:Ig-like domain-containing protein n=1 Tax=Romanomermis culicivorax TaxID=13658 RepID=A0A915KQ03_ROMCU